MATLMAENHLRMRIKDAIPPLMPESISPASEKILLSPAPDQHTSIFTNPIKTMKLTAVLALPFLLPLTSAGALPQKIEYRTDAEYIRCMNKLPRNSCLAELFYAIKQANLSLSDSCKRGGILGGNEPFAFKKKMLTGLGRYPVCSHVTWQHGTGKAIFGTHYYIRAEDYGVICDTCYGSAEKNE
ncbi:hypothetical protein CDD80_4062 [Ophiocordyceps camponoti-rufipedis]|uniref:Uncharacterized protein n=1 Tax=Ophiocordyceps camponoti-rufipedis TaxID=2004952 RepID=A0A2C5ZF97_9HYPO|nr:hypothetical protein CDD80_4062 [Ophiocordyceps camponoti-rufipedis]